MPAIYSVEEKVKCWPFRAHFSCKSNREQPALPAASTAQPVTEPTDDLHSEAQAGCWDSQG